MGFSLECFLAELENILNEAVPDRRKIELLEKAIQDGRQYAKECGQL